MNYNRTTNTRYPQFNRFSPFYSTTRFNIKRIRPFEVSSARTEMPNKYQIVSLPKVRVEDVYITNFVTEPSQLSEDRNPIVPKSNENRFYYSEDNEILSLDGFFRARKGLENYRKKKDKVELRQKLQEKAQKIEEIRINTTALSTSPRRIQTDPGTIYSENSTALLKSPDFISVKSAGEGYQIDLSTILRRNETAKETSRKEIGDGPNNNISNEENIYLTAPKQANEKRNLTKGNLTVKVGQSKEMATEQKFREQEIHKHLFHMTLSPKKMKMSPLTPQIEKNYEKMFKSPMVMDYAVDKCIKKSKDIALSEDQQTLTGRSVQDRSYFTSPLRTEGRLYTEGDSHGTYERVLSPESYPEKGKEVGKVIKDAIEEIDSILRRGNPTLPIPKRPKKSIRIIKTKNKHGLKFDNDYKKIVKEMIETHSTLSSKIKKLNRVYNKEYGPSSVKNQNYVSFYN